MVNLNHKFYRDKQLRALWKEYCDLLDARKDQGIWVKVQPYQRGWTRTFVLRNDINNRQDAYHILQVLALVNNVLFSRNKEFVYYGYRRKKSKPIEQKLGSISVDQYEQLSEKLRSYFIKHDLVEVRKYGRREWATRYIVKNEYWFVFKIEPNIITHQWQPNPSIESRIAEINNKIERQNLRPKLEKAMGWRNSRDRDFLTPWIKNKYGTMIQDYSEQENSNVD